MSDDSVEWNHARCFDGEKFVDTWGEWSGQYKGRTVKLNKPFRTPDGPKKFSIYVKNDKGNVVKVNFNGSEGVDK